MSAASSLAVLLLLACALQVQSQPTARQDGEHVAADQESAADWPFFRGGRELHGVAHSELPENPVLLWSFATEGKILSSAVIAEGLVFFGSRDAKVYALDAVSGELRWSFTTGDQVEAPPLWIDGALYIGSSDGGFHCLDAATGAERWKVQTGSKILAGATWQRHADGLRILVCGYDHSLYAFDAASGEVLWSYAADDRLNGTPAIAAGRIVFGGCDSTLHVLSADAGELLFALPLGEKCHVAASVAVEGDRAWFGHHKNAFLCVDLDARKVLWTYDASRAGFFSAPAIAGSRVLFGGRDKRLHCLNKADGKLLWTFSTRRKVDGSPLVCGERVLFGSGDGRLYIVGLQDGKESWTYDIGRSIFASPAVAHGRLYIGADDGSLYAFGAKAQDK